MSPWYKVIRRKNDGFVRSCEEVLLYHKIPVILYGVSESFKAWGLGG